MASLTAIERLPPEILSMVFSQLDRKYLILSLRTCKLWNNLLTTCLTVRPSDICIIQETEWITIGDIEYYYSPQEACRWLSKASGVIRSLAFVRPFYAPNVGGYDQLGIDFGGYFFSRPLALIYISSSRGFCLSKNYISITKYSISGLMRSLIF
jgi:hypothetical protein